MTEQEITFRSIFKKHHKLLVAFATKRLRDKLFAEDIAADAFIKLLKIPEQRSESEMKAYLYRCVSNACINKNLHKQRTGCHYEITELEIAYEGIEDTNIAYAVPDEILDMKDPELLLMRLEVANLVALEIEAMPKGQKKVAYLMKIGFKPTEIAEMLHLSQDTIRTQIFRLKKKLEPIYRLSFTT